jgi:hypothetical protein
MPVAPTVAAIARLADAVARTSDYAGRVAGSEVAWSRDWRTSFDDAFLRRLAELLVAT